MPNFSDAKKKEATSTIEVKVKWAVSHLNR